MPKRSHELRCSFCNKPDTSVRKLIAGPHVFICDECVDVCADIIADDTRFRDETGRVVLEPPPADAVVAPAASGLAVRSSLCNIPVPIQDVLPIHNRGALCPGCVGEIQAALAENEDDGS